MLQGTGVDAQRMEMPFWLVKCLAAFLHFGQ